jgi:hypothetical protein
MATLRKERTDFGRALHDNPLTKLKAQQEERGPTSPIARLKSIHDIEGRELNAKIVKESRELHNHTVNVVRRRNSRVLSRPMLKSTGESKPRQWTSATPSCIGR